MPNRLHESYVVVGSLTGYAYSDMLCRNGEAAEADGTPAVTFTHGESQSQLKTTNNK